MASNAVNLKVFLRSDDLSEAKRFSIEDASILKSFLFFKEKLQIMFPRLRENVFQVTWKGINCSNKVIVRYNNV